MGFFVYAPCGAPSGIWSGYCEQDLSLQPSFCFRAVPVSKAPPPRSITHEQIAMMLDAQATGPVCVSSKEIFKVANSREALRILSCHDERTIKRVRKEVLINLVQATIYEGMRADALTQVASFLLAICRKNMGIAILESLGKEGCEQVPLGTLSVLASSVTEEGIKRARVSSEVAETLIRKLPFEQLESSEPLRALLMRDYFMQDA